jgi:hypothetical protein
MRLQRRDESMIEDAQGRFSVPLRAENQVYQVHPEPRLRTVSLVRDLEDLRDRVLQKLSSIEELARSRAGAASAEITRLEQTLRERVAELETERNLPRSTGDQQEANWKQLLAQLENDRQLLSEAWERLERERIDLAGTGTGAAHHRPRLAEGANSPCSQASLPVAAHRQPTVTDAANPVAEKILRQFQALNSDVRRTADARYSSR